MIKVISLPERVNQILELLKSQTGKNFPVMFQGEQKYLNVYTVGVEFPVYRLSNGRTQAAQEEYVYKNKLSQKFFDDPENIEAQEVQHEILKGMIHKEGLKDLFKQQEQTEPLILDSKGYIANGNRRMCTMRELLYESPEKYKHFEYIKVVFLPPCTPKDILSLEAQLQIQRDVRADYSWIDEAFLLRKTRKNYDMSDLELARLYGFATKKNVQESIAKLDLVDKYLKSRLKPKQYSILEKSEYAFKELQKYLPQTMQQAKKDLFIETVFALIDQTIDGTKKGRIYEDIKILYNQVDNMYEQAKKEAIQIGIVSKTNPAPANPLDILGGGNSSDEYIGEIISTEGGKKLLANVAVDTIANYNEIKKDVDKKLHTLTMLQKINTFFENALSGLECNPEKEPIEKQLNNIEANVLEIKNWLSK